MYASGYAAGDLNDDPTQANTGAHDFVYDGIHYDLRLINEDNGVRGLIQARATDINPLSVNGAGA